MIKGVIYRQVGESSKTNVVLCHLRERGNSSIETRYPQNQVIRMNLRARRRVIRRRDRSKRNPDIRILLRDHLLAPKIVAGTEAGSVRKGNTVAPIRVGKSGESEIVPHRRRESGGKRRTRRKRPRTRRREGVCLLERRSVSHLAFSYRRNLDDEIIDKVEGQKR